MLVHQLLEFVAQLGAIIRASSFHKFIDKRIENLDGFGEVQRHVSQVFVERGRTVAHTVTTHLQRNVRKLSRRTWNTKSTFLSQLLVGRSQHALNCSLDVTLRSCVRLVDAVLDHHIFKSVERVLLPTFACPVVRLTGTFPTFIVRVNDMPDFVDVIPSKHTHFVVI